MSFQDEIKELNKTRIGKIMSEEDSILIVEELYNKMIDDIITNLKNRIRSNIKNNKVMSNNQNNEKIEWVESEFSFSPVEISSLDNKDVKSGDYFSIPGLDIENINDRVKEKLYYKGLPIKGVTFLYLRDKKLVLKNLYNLKPSFMAKHDKRNVELTSDGIKFSNDVKAKAKDAGINISLYFRFNTSRYDDSGRKCSSVEYEKFTGNSIVIKSGYYYFKDGSLCLKAKVNL